MPTVCIINTHSKVALKKHIIDQERLVRTIEHILLDKTLQKHFSLIVDCQEIIQQSPILCNLLITYPIKILEYFSCAALDAQKRIMESHYLKDEMCVKPNVHIRVSNLPYCPPILRTSIPRSVDMGKLVLLACTVIRTTTPKILEYKREYQCLDCGGANFAYSNFEHNNEIFPPKACSNYRAGCTGVQFVSVKNIMEHQQAGPKNSAAAHPNEVSFQRHLGADHQKPAFYCCDYQEIKVQEQVQMLEMGSIPRSINVVLLHDLVDTIKPGDNIILVGILMRRWAPLVDAARCDVELVIQGNYITVNNSQLAFSNLTEEKKTQFQAYWYQFRTTPLAARNNIVRSFCPQVYGLHYVKLAIILILIGGTKAVNTDGMKVRGESHLLLVGDPGTAKSQLLKYAAMLSPRSVLTTGTGTSSAGLTVAAVKEGNGWQLEAGALVLADGGICCIDEFSGIKETDKAVIHEAIESQTISLAKAGLICKLNTRCSVLAATNPIRKYDFSKNIAENIGVKSPLLSRFDLVIILLDQRNERWDSYVADYILEQHTAYNTAGVAGHSAINSNKPCDSARAKQTRPQKELPPQPPPLIHNRPTGSANVDNQVRSFSVIEISNTPTTAPTSQQSQQGARGEEDLLLEGEDEEEDEDILCKEGKNGWSIEMLQAYISYCKSFAPEMTPEASEVLQGYYILQRNVDVENADHTTLRLLQSLARLATAHAKLMLRKQVTIDDATNAIILMEFTMHSSSIFEVGSPLYLDFSKNSDHLQQSISISILKKLNLEHLLAQYLQ